MMSAVELVVDDGVARVTLNRPESLNAINDDVRDGLVRVGDEMSADPTVRAIVLTGAGERAFCAGADLKAPAPVERNYAEREFANRPGPLLRAFPEDVPIIAAINGYAIGGGLELALTCDIRIAAEHATLGLSEVRVGSIPGGGGTQRLTRVVGPTMAMYMALTGDRIDAAHAERSGLVSEVCTSQELLPRAHVMARRIADNAPLAVRAVRRLVRNAPETPLEMGLQSERYVWGLLRDTEDRLEGRRAFAEKREPQYVGR